MKIWNHFSEAYRHYVQRDPKLVAYRRWMRRDGNHALLPVCYLNKGDLVFDVGGYAGDFAGEMTARYGATVLYFEPVRSFYQKALLRFSSIDSIHCFNFGLSDQDGVFEIALSENASSVIRNIPGVEIEKVELRSFENFVKEYGITNIELLKVNIEGGEYALLQHIFDCGLISMIGTLRIQFHDFVPGADVLRSEIRRRLLVTHVEEWCYPFVWESWVRRAEGRPQ